MVTTELERLRETFEKLGGEELGLLFQGLDAELETVSVKISIIKQVLTNRLEADEALELDAGSTGTWSLVASYGWDQGALVALKEALSDDELRAGRDPRRRPERARYGGPRHARLGPGASKRMAGGVLALSRPGDGVERVGAGPEPRPAP